MNCGPEAIAEAIIAGNRRMLARAITLIESRRTNHQEDAQRIIERCLKAGRQARRIALTGSPGVGKSTFIEALGETIIAKGKKVAVLAIDPSSHASKGSILGDKARMEKLAVHEAAFIRPTPSSGHLGGSAPRTHETIILCEAAGYDVVLVETVGVGQSEIIVDTMVDFVLLLLLPGSGDDLQGIKRGIMEIADAIAITKCDGMLEAEARISQTNADTALRMLPPRHRDMPRKSYLTSAMTGLGIEDVWHGIEMFFSRMQAIGAIGEKRRRQLAEMLEGLLQEGLKEALLADPAVTALRKTVEPAVIAGSMSPLAGSRLLLDAFIRRR